MAECDERLTVVRRPGERWLQLRHEFTGTTTFAMLKLPLVPLVDQGTWWFWTSEVSRELASAGPHAPGLPGGTPDFMLQLDGWVWGRYPVPAGWFKDFDLGWLSGGGGAVLVCGDAALDAAALSALMETQTLPSGLLAAIVLDNDFDFAWFVWSEEFDSRVDGMPDLVPEGEV